MSTPTELERPAAAAGDGEARLAANVSVFFALPRSAAARLYVVADPTSSLAPGHCVVGVDDDEGKIEGPVAIMTDPTLAPEDVLVLDAVAPPERLLRAVGRLPRGVLVLPSTGAHPTAEMLCGGDYDGDQVVVVWAKEVMSEIERGNGGAEALLARRRAFLRADPRPDGPVIADSEEAAVAVAVAARGAELALKRAGGAFKKAIQGGHAVPGDGRLALAHFALKDFPYDATPFAPRGYAHDVGDVRYADEQASLRAKLADELDARAFTFDGAPAFDAQLLELAKKKGDGGDASVVARAWSEHAGVAYNGTIRQEYRIWAADIGAAYNRKIKEACSLREGPLRNARCAFVKREFRARFLREHPDLERAALELYAAAHDKFRKTGALSGCRFAFEIAAPELLRAKRAPPRGP